MPFPLPPLVQQAAETLSTTPIGGGVAALGETLASLGLSGTAAEAATKAMTDTARSLFGLAADVQPSPRQMFEALSRMLEALWGQFGQGRMPFPIALDPAAPLTAIADAVNQAEARLNQTNLAIGGGSVAVTLDLGPGGQAVFTLNLTPAQGIRPMG